MVQVRLVLLFQQSTFLKEWKHLELCLKWIVQPCPGIFNGDAGGIPCYIEHHQFTPGFLMLAKIYGVRLELRLFWVLFEGPHSTTSVVSRSARFEHETNDSGERQGQQLLLFLICHFNKAFFPQQLNVLQKGIFNQWASIKKITSVSGLFIISYQSQHERRWKVNNMS